MYAAKWVGMTKEEIAAEVARNNWFITMAALGFDRAEIQRELDAGHSRDEMYRAAVYATWRPGEPWTPAEPSPGISYRGPVMDFHQQDPEAERVECSFCGTPDVLIRYGALHPHFPVMPGGRCPATGETPAVAREMADLREEIRTYPHP